MKKRVLIVGGVVLVLFIAGIATYMFTRPYVPTNDLQVRSVIYGLGDELGQVSLLSTPEALAKAMDQHYALYIRPDLLENWKTHPSLAPGRETALPRSDQIKLTTLVKNEDGTYTAEALILPRNSSGLSSTTVQGTPVRFTLAQGPDGWQISGYEVRTSH